jgi:hypothetical protein
MRSLRLLCYIRLRLDGHFPSAIRKYIGREAVDRLERHVKICNGKKNERHVVEPGVPVWTFYQVYWRKASAPGKKATKHSFPVVACPLHLNNQ